MGIFCVGLVIVGFTLYSWPAREAHVEERPSLEADNRGRINLVRTTVRSNRPLARASNHGEITVEDSLVEDDAKDDDR